MSTTISQVHRVPFKVYKFISQYLTDSVD